MRAPKEVTLGGAPKEVTLGDAPKEVTLGDAPKEVTLGDAPKEVTLGGSRPAARATQGTPTGSGGASVVRMKRSAIRSLDFASLHPGYGSFPAPPPATLQPRYDVNHHQTTLP